MRLKFILLCLFTAQILIGQKQGLTIDSMLTNYSKLGLFNGSALVYQNKNILLSKGYGMANLKDNKPNTSQSIFQIYSITKPFTSTLVLMLHEQGKLSIDDKVSKYILNFPKGDSITIKQLLSHTSGLFEYTTEQNNFSAFEQDRFISYLNSKPFYFSPGTDWSYSNSGYWLLGFIIEKATLMSYEKAIEKYIFQKLKMKNSGLNYAKLKNKHKTIGYVTMENTKAIEAEVYPYPGPYSAGAIYSTTEDLLLFHQALQSEKLLSRKTKEHAYTEVKNRYGLGWMLFVMDGDNMVAHSGGAAGYRTDFIRIPEKDICIVLLNNTETGNVNLMAQNILKILHGKPSYLPNGIKQKESEVSKYFGTYEVPGMMEIIVGLENGILYGDSPGRGKTLLFQANQQDVFFATDLNTNFTFFNDEQGKIKGLRFEMMGQKVEAFKK